MTFLKSVAGSKRARLSSRLSATAMTTDCGSHFWPARIAVLRHMATASRIQGASVYRLSLRGSLPFCLASSNALMAVW